MALRSEKVAVSISQAIAEKIPVFRLRSLPMGGWVFLVWLFTLTFVPFAIIITISLLSRSGIGALEWNFTLANYERCFQWLYAKVLWKTFGLASVSTLFCLVLGFPAAYYLAKAQGRQRQIGLILLFIPFWTNFILRVYALVSVLGTNGLLNQVLMSVGITQDPVRILYTRYGVYVGLVYNYLPFLIVPIYAALEKLDDSLMEASSDLGATKFQTFIKVVVPNIKHGILVGCVFVFIPMLGEYLIPDLLGGAKEVFLGNIMFSQFFVMQDWPFGSAIAGLLSTVLLLTMLGVSRWSK
jgi:spermidine/putrescine transport system permease protein